MSDDIRAHLVDGREVVVRSKRNGANTILSGTVEIYDGNLSGDEAIIAELTGGHFWIWRDEDGPETIRRHEAGKDDGPPKRRDGEGYADDYNHQPQLRERPGEPVELILKAAAWNGVGSDAELIYYAPQPAGEVVDFAVGSRAGPTQLLAAAEKTEALGV